MIPMSFGKVADFQRRRQIFARQNCVEPIIVRRRMGSLQHGQGLERSQHPVDRFGVAEQGLINTDRRTGAKLLLIVALVGKP